MSERLTDAEMEAVYGAAPAVVDDAEEWEWHVLHRTVARIANERAAKAWDEGAAKASPHGGAYLRSFYAENPYRTVEVPDARA